MAGDDVTITIRADGGQAIRAFRDVNGQLRDMRGRFVSEGSVMSRSMNQVTGSLGGVRGALIPLASAAVPLGAALAPIAVKAAGAGVAVAAFGAAVAGQVGHLTEAADAQDKYTKAVTQYGRGSKQAAEAQRMVSTTLASMPQSTARAAVAMSTLKDGFKAWSDEMSAFTMTPVEKSFTLLGQLVPKLTPMVKGASAELDRLVTVTGGAMASPGFDALTEKVSEFANSALKDAVDGTIHFMRALSEGDTSGPVKAFMDYAAQNGPALRETLSSVGAAVSTLAEAAANAGPGMLTLVNAAAKLVASLPPELVTVLMQAAVALKAVQLAGAGFAAVAGGVQAFATRLTALQAASVAAGGGMAGLRAAFLSLGTAAKASIVVAGVAAVAVAFGKLAEVGREAPPNVDKLTTSLGQLGRTGQASGEAARLFGDDLDTLYESVRSVSDPSLVDNLQQGLVKVFSLGFADSTPVSEAKDRLNGIDDALSNLVKGGKADVAAAAFKRMSDEYVAGGGKLSDFTGQMDGYEAALADVKFEQELAADAMGVFGQAAQDTSATLAAQKQSADGLRQSILALNEVNRSAYDAQIGFEASLDSLSESFEKHGATLNLDTEAGRANATAMSQAAKAQDEFIAAGVAAGDSLGSMTKKSGELRESMLKLATEAFDGNKKKATDYANTLLGAPSEIKTLVKLERADAISGLKSVQAAADATPDAKKITVDTLNGAAIKALEAVGLKTKQLPNGKTQVSTANGQAIGAIGSVARALANLNGKTATTYTYHKIMTEYFTAKNPAQLAAAHGRAHGGLAPGYADGGQVVQTHPNGGLIDGPGTGTSDSILELSPNGGTYRTSNREYIVQESAVRKYGVGMLDALNAGRLKLAGYAKGGLTDAMKDARADLRGQFGISHFGRMAGYQRTGFEKTLGAPSGVSSLVSALNEAARNIRAATSGRTESRLLRQLDGVGKSLIKYEKQLTSVNKALEKARDKLSDLRSAASSLAGSVKSGVLGSANITRGVSGDGPVTTRSIMGGLTASRDKATAFAGALSGLKKKGLSSSLLRQIAEAGIEGGGLETAGALLSASGSEIKSLNDLQSQIGKAAGSAGKTTADAVYGKAIKEQTASVHKLQKSQDKLEKSMAHLARVMEKAISRAVGKKAAGGIVGAAASGGVRSGLTWVGEHEPELLDLPSGSRVWSGPDSRRMAAAPWASMLNTPRHRPAAGGSASAARGGSEQPMVIQVRIGDKDFGELWVETGRRKVRAIGSIEATLKPPRGR